MRLSLYVAVIVITSTSAASAYARFHWPWELPQHHRAAHHRHHAKHHHVPVPVDASTPIDCDQVAIDVGTLTPANRMRILGKLTDNQRSIISECMRSR